MEDVTVALEMEQVGADRGREGRIIDHERNVIACPLAGALPACADLHIAREHAVIWGVFGVARDHRDDVDLAVERQRPDGASISVISALEDADMCHDLLRVGGWLAKDQRAVARQTNRPSPASSVHTGTARATTAVIGNGPK